MKRKQIVLHSVAKQLFVTGRWSQHGLRERSKEEHSIGRNKLLGKKYSKHCTDFQHYYPNTISSKAITMHKTMKMRWLRSRPMVWFTVLRNNSGNAEPSAFPARPDGESGTGAPLPGSPRGSWRKASAPPGCPGAAGPSHGWGDTVRLRPLSGGSPPAVKPSRKRRLAAQLPRPSTISNRRPPRLFHTNCMIASHTSLPYPPPKKKKKKKNIIQCEITVICSQNKFILNWLGKSAIWKRGRN